VVVVDGVVVVVAAGVEVVVTDADVVAVVLPDRSIDSPSTLSFPEALCPTNDTAPIATTAIRARRSAYSTRLAPRSSCLRLRIFDDPHHTSK